MAKQKRNRKYPNRPKNVRQQVECVKKVQKICKKEGKSAEETWRIIVDRCTIPKKYRKNIGGKNG